MAVLKLTQEFATTHASRLVEILSRIPLVSVAKEDVVCNKNKDKIFNNKWQLSFCYMHDDQINGVLISYIRDPDEHYQQQTIYLANLAVDKNHERRGIAHKLIDRWILQARKLSEQQKELGRKHLTTCAVQTNSASWNKNVSNLYKSYGFLKIGTKNYENRIDDIFFLELQEQNQ